MIKNRLTIATSVFLAGGILLTGCSTNADATAPAASESTNSELSIPSETAKQTTKPAASTEKELVEKELTDAELKAEGEALMKELEKNPLRIDIDEALKEYSTPEVVKYSKKYDVKAGIKTGLGVYQDLITMSNFYTVRDASKDLGLINFGDLSDTLTADIEKSIKKDKQFTGIFTMDSKGKFEYTDTKDKKVSYTATQIPYSTFNTPGITINEDDNLQIDGWQYMTLPTDKGTLEIKMSYYIELIPVDSDTFKVNGFGWSIDTKKDIKLIK